MLVRFLSSETGEIMMFSDTARILLSALGKRCSAKGTFTREEMLPAANALRQTFESDEAPAQDGGDAAEERPVGMNRRAWPLIDMLERTARGDDDANIVWRASADF
ncbi:MAG: DUF1840 domain-containing protein [Betaproteobacteria bacterium]